jgi:hypothetical protein
MVIINHASSQKEGGSGVFWASVACPKHPTHRFIEKLLNHRVFLLFSFFFALLSACTLTKPAVETPLPGTESNPMNHTPEQTPTAIVISIDAQAEVQTIEGFGAAGAWWAQDVGGWEDEKRALVADLLFDREKGAGLSFYRYNIGGGDGENIQDAWRRAETFEVAPGQYDWTRDANAMWMLRAARERGVEH